MCDLQYMHRYVYKLLAVIINFTFKYNDSTCPTKVLYLLFRFFLCLLYDLFNLRTVLVSLNLTVACMCYNLYLLTGQYMFVIFG